MLFAVAGTSFVQAASWNPYGKVPKNYVYVVKNTTDQNLSLTIDTAAAVAFKSNDTVIIPQNPTHITVTKMTFKKGLPTIKTIIDADILAKTSYNVVKNPGKGFSLVAA